MRHRVAGKKLGRSPSHRKALLRNLVVFSLQYTVGVISAIDAGDRAVAFIAGRAISGATAGYFIGSTVALLIAYRSKRAVG